MALRLQPLTQMLIRLTVGFIYKLQSCVQREARYRPLKRVLMSAICARKLTAWPRLL